MTRKILVTNLGQLTKKYGAGGVLKIQNAIEGLIAADDKRSIQTQQFSLDDTADMQKVNGVAVTNAFDPRQNKEALDAIYRTFTPEYLVLLGATDVIPHQPLDNLLFGKKKDVDKFAWGDIPYACEAPYSSDPRQFIGPTRVVGRIPDITKGNDPGYLVQLLATASNWQSRDRGNYADYLGISAWVWRESTELSLGKIFGCPAPPEISPPKGPRWGRALISNRSHFINCHGNLSTPYFKGQRGEHNYPIAHSASWLDGRVSDGTVATAECCYGAELYDPSTAPGNQMGICNTYLANGAYGFFGSTTIAYGSDIGNSSADLICQYFFEAVLCGASLGRATLEARQRFAQSQSKRRPIGPMNLKTLAQFNLLGDPSIHPVQAPPPAAGVKLKGPMRDPETRIKFRAYDRADRRQQLVERGLGISQGVLVVQNGRPVDPTTPIGGTLRTLARDNGLRQPDFLAFPVGGTDGRLTERAFVYVGIAKAGRTVEGITQLVALVVEQEDGEIVSIEKLFSR